MARLGTQKKPPCVDSNVPVCTGTRRTCVATCGRGAGTHGGVFDSTHVGSLDGHTGERRGKEGEGRRVTVSSAHRNLHISYHVLQRGSPKETLGSYPFKV